MQDNEPSTTVGRVFVMPSSASSPQVVSSAPNPDVVESFRDSPHPPQPSRHDGYDELLGRTLNDTYLIESVLGEGGMGRVYRARHSRIPQKLFALKVLHPEYARDPEQLARFQREAEAAAAISHPNVVGVFDVGRTSDGYSYLACELLSGTDLDAHVERVGKLDVISAVRICLQICEALEAAHAENVVHRDLKPQNVFLLNDADGRLPAFPRVKVVDFGLSRFLDHSDSQLTKTGVVMGTPAFMAPEQATGQRGDHRVDIYGIGVLLYAALTGRPPFEEETIPATLLAVMVNEAPRPRSFNPEVPETLELVIQRAMAKNPDERYSTVTELKAALEVFDSAAAPHPADREGSSASRRLTRKSSLLHLGDEAYELRTSRPRLLFFSFVMVSTCVAFLASAVSGLELFTGPLAFTRTELGLLLLGLCGTLAMPVVLGIRHFKKTVWTNSAKVLDLLGAIRGPMFAGLVAYGIAAIFIRFCDDFVGRFGFDSMLVRNPGIGWAGFTWLLPLIAFVAAALSHQKRKWSEGNISPARRHLLGAPLMGLTVFLGLAILTIGLNWRHAEIEAARALPQVKHVDIEAPVPGENAAQALTPPAPPPPEPVRLATDDELAAAIEQGVDGLLPLSEKYPRDPRVLEPLLLAFSSRATGFADAMATAQKLLVLAPEKADSETLALMVRRAAETPGNASTLAFEIMTESMGSSGPDLLFQLAHSESKASERALAALSTEEVQKKFSPALRIALDLKKTDSCEGRLPLLARAKSLGDARSAQILSPLAQGSKRGCGKWKSQPCPATCKDQSKEYLDAVKAIHARSGGSRL